MNIAENPSKGTMLWNTNKHQPEFVLNKRANQPEYEVSKRPSRVYGDRFIPRRSLPYDKSRNLKYRTRTSIRDIFMLQFTPNYWWEHNFQVLMRNCFDLHEHRLLDFFASTWNHSIVYSSNREDSDWPCKPRSKPSAYVEASHDWPLFEPFSDNNLTDWSVNGQIAVGFGQDVVIWNRAENQTILFYVKNIRSLAYCPKGEYLAIGIKDSENPVLQLWSIILTNEVMVTNEKVFNSKHSKVQCIDWSKSGEEIACGTYSGWVYILSVPGLRTIHKMHKHQLPITVIKFSPTMRYLASGDVEGNIVIYNWSSCDVYLNARSRSKLHITFDWHPWNGVDLAISEDVPASIVILNVPEKQIVAHYQRMDSKIVINSIKFCRITGELLVSISKHDSSGCITFSVLVLSSLSRIVDLLQIPDGGARLLMCSPNGTTVATVGNDETITMWNFHPENRRNRFQSTRDSLTYKRCKPFKYEPVYGDQFKLWSRLK